MGWFVSGKKASSKVKEYPEVVIKERLKRVEIKGFSRMMDAQEYYEDLLKKLENYFFVFQRTLLIDLSLEYINTSSLKWLFYVLTSLEDQLKEGGLIEINWYYEFDDEIIQDTGDLLKSNLKLPFHLKELD